MVSTLYDATSNQGKFIIRPNQSMTWQQNLLFLYSIFAVSGGIAITCMFLGIWLVLPFAGLEMFFLTACLYIVSRRVSQCEVITINRNDIIIESGQCTVQKRVTFPRSWSTVILQKSIYRWHMSHLFIGAYGKYVEIGHHLTESERITLANALKQMIMGQAKEWQNSEKIFYSVPDTWLKETL